MADPEVPIPEGFEDAGPVPPDVVIPVGFEDAGPVDPSLIPEGFEDAGPVMSLEERAQRTVGPVVILPDGTKMLRSGLASGPVPSDGREVFTAEGKPLLPSTMRGITIPEAEADVAARAARNAKLTVARQLALKHSGSDLAQATDLAKTFNVPVDQVLPHLGAFREAAAASQESDDDFYAKNKVLVDSMGDDPALMAAVIVDPNVSPLVQALRTVKDAGVWDAVKTAGKWSMLPWNAPTELLGTAKRVWDVANGGEAYSFGELLTGSSDSERAAEKAADLKKREQKQTKFESPEAKAIREEGTAAVISQRAQEAWVQQKMMGAAFLVMLQDVRNELGADNQEALDEARAAYQTVRAAATRPLLLGDEGTALGMVGDNLQALTSSAQGLMARGSGFALGTVGGAIGGALAGGLRGGLKGARAGAAVGADLGGAAAANVFGYAGSFVPETGGAYIELTEAKTEGGLTLSKLEAAGGAIAYGSGASVLENLGAEGQMRPLTEMLQGRIKQLLLKDPYFRKRAADMARHWATASLTEGGTEGAQAELQQLVEYAGKSLKDEKLQSGPATDTEQTLTEGFAGAFGGGVITAGSTAIAATVDLVKTDQVARTSAQQVALLSTLAGQDVVKAAPEQFARVVAESSGVTEFYVDVDEAVRLFQKEGKAEQQILLELEQAGGAEAVDNYKAAVATGGKFQVPMGDALKTWLQSELGQKLLMHTTTADSAPTPAQLQDAKQLEAIREHAEEMAKKAIVELEDEAAFEDALEQMRRDIVETSRGLAGISNPQEYARDAVNVARAVYATAREENSTWTWKQTLQQMGLLEYARGDEAPVGSTRVLVKANDPHTDLRNVLDFGGRTGGQLDVEERATKLFLDPVSNLREVEAFDREGVPEGFQVAMVTTPDAKAINDHPDGSHDATNALLRRMASVVQKVDPQAARVGTNFAVRVRDQSALDALLGQFREVLPSGLQVVGAVAPTRQAAGTAMDELVDQQRKDGLLPARGGTAFDVSKLATTRFDEGVQLAPPAPLTDALLNAVDAEGDYEGREKFGNRAFLDPQVPGLLSGLGWRHVQKGKFTVALDLRGLRLANIELGKATGDAMLRAFGEAVVKMGGQAFSAAHLSGDEYALTHDSKEALEEFVADLEADLQASSGVAYTRPNGTVMKVPVAFRWGIAEGTYGRADQDLNRRKLEEAAAAQGSRGADALASGAPGGEGRDGGDLGARAGSVELREARALRRRGGERSRPFRDVAQEAAAESAGEGFGDGADERSAGLSAFAEPEVLTEARAWVATLRSPARKARFNAWLDYAAGLRERPTGDLFLERGEGVELVDMFGGQLDDPNGTFFDTPFLQGIGPSDYTGPRRGAKRARRGEGDRSEAARNEARMADANRARGKLDFDAAGRRVFQSGNRAAPLELRTKTPLGAEIQKALRVVDLGSDAAGSAVMLTQSRPLPGASVADAREFQRKVDEVLALIRQPGEVRELLRFYSILEDVESAVRRGAVGEALLLIDDAESRVEVEGDEQQQDDAVGAPGEQRDDLGALTDMLRKTQGWRSKLVSGGGNTGLVVESLSSVREGAGAALTRLGVSTAEHAEALRVWGDQVEEQTGRLYQDSVSLMEGTETLPIEKKGKKPTIFELATAMAGRFLKSGQALLTREHNNSAEARERIARDLVKEVLYEYAPDRRAKSGAGWYSQKYPRALQRLEAVFPALKEREHRTVFTAILAVTSDGADVKANLLRAIRIFQQWDTGKGVMREPVATGEREAVSSTLETLEALAREHGPNLEAYLLEEVKYADLKRAARERGLKPPSDFLAETMVPRSAMALGPKVGLFFANLMGNEKWLTMDRWWNRTINRLRGEMRKLPPPADFAKMRKLMGKPKATDAEVIAQAFVLSKARMGRYRLGDEWVDAAKTAVVLGERYGLTPEQALRKLASLEKRAKDEKFKLKKEVADRKDALATHPLVAKAVARRKAHADAAPQYELDGHNFAKKFVELNDSPSSAGDRAFMMETAARAVELLKDEHKLDLTVADLQATIWYYEKRLFATLQGQAPQDVAYDDVVSEVLEEVGGAAPAVGAGAEADARASAVPRVGVDVAGGRSAVDSEARRQLQEEDRWNPDASGSPVGHLTRVGHDPNDPFLFESIVGPEGRLFQRDTEREQSSAPKLSDGRSVIVDAENNFRDPDAESRVVLLNVENLRAEVEGYLKAYEKAGSGINDERTTQWYDYQRQQLRELVDSAFSWLDRGSPTRAIEAMAEAHRYEIRLIEGLDIDSGAPLTEAGTPATTYSRMKVATALYEPVMNGTLGTKTDVASGEIDPAAKKVWDALPEADKQVVQVALDEFEQRTGRLYQATEHKLSDGRNIIFDTTVGENAYEPEGRPGAPTVVAALDLAKTQAAIDALKEKWSKATVRPLRDDDADLGGEGLVSNFMRDERDARVLALRNEVSQLNFALERIPQALSEGRLDYAEDLVKEAMVREAMLTAAQTDESLLDDLGALNDLGVAMAENDGVVSDGDRDFPFTSMLQPTLDALNKRELLTEARAGRLGLSPEDQQVLEVAADEFEQATGRMRQDEEKKAGAPPRGYFELGQKAPGVARVLKVFLNRRADRSTVFHESAHGFLEMYRNLQDAPDLADPTRKRWERILKWLKVESTEAWDKLGKAARTEKHERWAKAFELYNKEGRAPSKGLAGTMARMKRWLTRIYGTVANIDGVELDDEVRAIFDSMLASEKEIAAQAGRRGKPVFNTAEEAGMTEEEFAARQEEEREELSFATREAAAAATRAALRVAEQDYREQLEAVRAEAEAEFDALPGRRAQLYLEGKAKDLLEVGVSMEPVVLDRRAVEEVVGGYGAKKFRTRNGAASPDDVAPLAGFTTGREMLQAVASLPKRDEWVEQRAKALVEERDPANTADLERLRAEVADGVQRYTEQRIEREWDELGRRAEPGSDVSALGRQVALQALKKAARTITDKMRVGRLNPAAVLQKERHASRLVRQAANRGNIDAARDWFRQQTLQVYTHRAVLDAIEERRRFLELAERLAKKEARARLGKADPRLRDAVDYLLGVFGLGPETELTGEALTAAAAVIEETGEVPGEWLQALQVPELLGSGDAMNLTVAGLRHLDGALRQLYAIAKFRNEVMVGEKLVERELVVDEMAEQGVKVLPRKPPPVTKSTESTLETLSSLASSIEGYYLLNPADLLRDLTGDDTEGVWWKAIIEPLRRAKYAEAEYLKKLVEPITKAMEALPESVKRRMRETVDGRKLFPGHIDAVLPRQRHELLMMALNVGNDGNLQRLTDGRKISVDEVAKAVDLLTDSELAWVQTVWDAAGSLREESFAMEERMTGLRPKGVEAVPFRLPSGRVLKGGYFPAVYDRRASVLGQKQAENALASLMDPRMTRVSTPHSHLKARVERVEDAALSLDVTVIYRHLTQVAHDLAFREPIKSVGSLLLPGKRIVDGESRPDNRVMEVLRERLGVEKADTFMRWLKDVGGGTGSNVTPLDPYISAARSAFAHVILGWKASTALGDFANPVAALLSTKLKTKHLAAATLDFMKAPMVSRKKALEASPWLRTMVDTTRQQFDKAMKGMLDKQAPLPLRWYKDNAFFFMETVAVATSTPVWMGSYRQAIAEGADHDTAVRFADDVLSQAWPSHHPLDVAGILRDRGVLGMSVVMYGYLSVAFRSYHRITAPLREQAFLDAIMSEKAVTLAKVSGRVLGFTAAWAVLGELLMGRGAEAGDADDDDPDNKLLKWSRWFLRKMLVAPLSTIPLLPLDRQIEAKALGKREPSPRTMPLLSMYEMLAKQFWTALDGDKGALERFLAVLKLLLESRGYPVAPLDVQGKYLLDVGLGEQQPEGVLDVVEGLSYGKKENQPENLFTAGRDVAGWLEEKLTGSD